MKPMIFCAPGTKIWVVLFTSHNGMRNVTVCWLRTSWEEACWSLRSAYWWGMVCRPDQWKEAA